MKARSVRFAFLILFMVGAMFPQAQGQEMNNEQMGKILEEEFGSLEGGLGAWQFTFGDHLVMVITDEAANRMRIFSPVISEKDIEADHHVKMLEANFHSALDAKYALYEGFVISVYTHPLRELTPDQLVDAARQVIILAATFGTSYQSTDMIFSPGADQEKEEEKKINEKPAKKS